jgi:hypothetical protein
MTRPLKIKRAFTSSALKMSKKTTINIKTSTAERLHCHADEEFRTAGQMADFFLVKAMNLVERKGYDALLDAKPGSVKK